MPLVERDNDFPDDVDLDFEQKLIALKESIIFLIDGTAPMFNNEDKPSYFQQCFEALMKIIKDKCLFSRKDKICIAIFGTKDSNCNHDNIFVEKEFGDISVDTINNLKKSIGNIDSVFSKKTADKVYPLYNALLFAYQTLSSNKTKSMRSIYLLTCVDNPTSNLNKRQIQELVESFGPDGVKFNVFGLPKSWNDKIFYKDLLLLSQSFNEDNYEKLTLSDLEKKITYPCRGFASLKLKIHGEQGINVSVYPVTRSQPRVPRKINLNKEDNQPLDSTREWIEVTNDDFNDESEQKKIKNVKADNILYSKNYGNSKVLLTNNEILKLKNLGLEKGIHILGFKPVSCDPLFHLRSAYLISYKKNCSNEQKELFMGLVQKCVEKGLMAICSMNIRTSIRIYSMIPSEDNCCFYAYKIPIRGEVRDLDSSLENYIFKSSEDCPTIKKAHPYILEMMTDDEVTFKPYQFENPKNVKIIRHLEAIAFDDILSNEPIDNTLPSKKQSIENLALQLKHTLELDTITDNKRKYGSQNSQNKKPKLDKAAMQEKVDNREVAKLTVPELKDFLKDVGSSATGTKAILVENVYKYFKK